MNRIFVTGDCHGKFEKFSFKNFPEGRELDKKDFVFIAGDFGGVWEQIESAKEKYWLDWLNQRPWTTLIILGNHENYEAIANNYPLESITIGNKKVGEFFRGRRLRSRVLIIERGELFCINGKSFFCFGGAVSSDKEYRVENISWWREEVASYQEMNDAIESLKIASFEVDVIITHEAPLSICQILYNDYFSNIRTRNIMNMFMEEVKDKVDFNLWFCGHHHIERKFKNINIIYNDIKEIT